MPNKIVEALLLEVAAIKTDVQWLKRAFWTTAGVLLTFNSITAVAILAYLLKK